MPRSCDHERRASLIAGTPDVITAVNIARENNLTIAAQGGGGGYVSPTLSPWS